jgi:hypothetical protein
MDSGKSSPSLQSEWVWRLPFHQRASAASALPTIQKTARANNTPNRRPLGRDDTKLIAARLRRQTTARQAGFECSRPVGNPVKFTSGGRPSKVPHRGGAGTDAACCRERGPWTNFDFAISLLLDFRGFEEGPLRYGDDSS